MTHDTNADKVSDERFTIFDLEKSLASPTEAKLKLGFRLYNVIDWTGQHRGQIALTPDEAKAIDVIAPRRSPPADMGVKVK